MPSICAECKKFLNDHAGRDAPAFVGEAYEASRKMDDRFKLNMRGARAIESTGFDGGAGSAEGAEGGDGEVGAADDGSDDIPDLLSEEEWGRTA
ncbi:unnamed protein product [Peniophora sp. CBMAI 1063]|nr:unnamed protein product [Peniophora sp. CBMAI 1063]